MLQERGRTLTVSIVTPGDVPRVEDPGVKGPDPRVRVPGLERERVLDLIGQPGKIERHEPVDGVLLAHPIQQLTYRVPLPARRQSVISLRETIRS